MIRIDIPLQPITKKNSQMIVNRRVGRKLVPMIIPSKQYRQFALDCEPYMPSMEPINEPVNVKMVFYMGTRRKVDLVNLQESICDILVKYKVLEDDNSAIIASMDGSRVLYDKKNPRTEIYISWLNEECSQRQ